MSPRARKWLTILAGLAVSALFLFLTLRKVDGAELLRESAKVSLPVLFLSMVPKLCGFACMAGRTTFLFRARGREAALGMGPALKSVLLGYVGNNLLPLRLGELLRIAFLAKRSHRSPEACVAVVALERLMDTFCLLLVLVLALSLSTMQVSSAGSVALACFLVVAALGTTVAAARFPRVLTLAASRVAWIFGSKVASFVTVRVGRFAEGLAGLSGRGGVAVVVGLSMSYWATMVLSVQIWLWAFGLALPWYAPLVVLSFLSFGTFLPASPGFVGTYHYFAAASLAVLGVAKGTATAFAVVGHAMATVPFTVLSLPIVAPELLRLLRRERSAAPSESTAESVS